MPFLVTPIDSIGPEQGKVYLFDANAWKFILSVPQQLTTSETCYLDFFDAIINLANNPLCKNRPLIYMNGLILSEVVNAHLKSRWDAFKMANSMPKLTYKQYRATGDYVINLQSLKSDFRGYTPYLKIETDLVFPPDQVLQATPSFSDFNDHYYFQIARALGFIVVTNDGDFRYQDVKILTMHGDLLKLK